MDQEPEERLRLLRFAFGDDPIELVGDGCEVVRRRPTSGLVRVRKPEFGLLRAEVFEAPLKPREPLVAALGGELALLECLVVALERLLGARDLGADRREPLLDLGSRAFCIVLSLRECLRDEIAVAVEPGELLEHGVFELLPREALVPAGFRPVLLAP